MHELSLTQSVVELCAARAAEQGARTRVTRVTLEVGALSAVMPDALRFCFDACTRNTALDGAELEIVEIPGRARCLNCAGEVTVNRLFDTCGCGSANLFLVSGEELRVKQMEVEECV